MSQSSRPLSCRKRVHAISDDDSDSDVAFAETSAEMGGWRASEQREDSTEGSSTPRALSDGPEGILSVPKRVLHETRRATPGVNANDRVVVPVGPPPTSCSRVTAASEHRNPPPVSERPGNDLISVQGTPPAAGSSRVIGDVGFNWASRVHRPPPGAHELKDLKPKGGEWTVRDAWEAWQSADGKWVFTSPWRTLPVPEPIFGAVHVTRQWNGHFGKQDPVCWPQIFVDNSRFRWLCAVRRDPHEENEHIIWTALTSNDIVPYSRAGVFGIVAASLRERLANVVRTQKERAEEFTKQNGAVSHLQGLMLQMTDAHERLTLPSTEADLIRQVACVQRFYLFVDAWLEFHTNLFPAYPFKDPRPRIRRPNNSEGVRSDLMGALTTSVEVAQKLFRARVPVWLVREPDRFTSDDSVVEITNCPVLPRTLHNNHGIFSPAVLASEWAGERHLSAIMCCATQYLDIEVSPRPADISSDRPIELKQTDCEAMPKRQKKKIKTAKGAADPGGAAGRSKVIVHSPNQNKMRKGIPQPSPQVANNEGSAPANPTTTVPKAKVTKQPRRHPKDIPEKFEDRHSTFMPPCNPAWQDALKRVDRSRPAPPQDDCWDYWLPEPALLANAANVERTHRFAWAWLRCRPAWFWLLQNDILRARKMKPPSLTDWKHYLNFGLHLEDAGKGATATAERKRLVVEHFDSAFGTENLLDKDEVVWCRDPFTGHEQQMREIIWELCDIGFRIELQELDRVLVPAPADPIRRAEFESARGIMLQQVFGTRSLMSRIQHFTAEGFSAAFVGDRVGSVEGLRRVILRWPNVPETIRAFPPLDVNTPAPEIVKVEQELCRYYCQSFWENAGRAATIPRLWLLTSERNDWADARLM